MNELQQELVMVKAEAFDLTKQNKILTESISGAMKVSGFEGNDLNQFITHLETLKNNQVEEVK